jgi:hypothetical protein
VDVDPFNVDVICVKIEENSFVEVSCGTSLSSKFI